MKFEKIYIWGPNKFSNRLMAEQIQKLCGVKPYCVCEDKEINRLMLDTESIVFCDCDRSEARNYCKQLARSSGLNGQGPSIALMNVEQSQELVHEVIRFRIQGIFYSSDDFDNINKGLKLVLSGGDWISRNILVQSLQVVRTQSNGKKNLDCKIITRREKEILDLIVFGYSNQDIAGKLFISANTVKTHVSNLYRKIDVQNRVQAILWAAENRSSEYNNGDSIVSV